MAEGDKNPITEVSIHDLYARMGNIEIVLTSHGEKLVAIESGLNGPRPLRTRVEALERWRAWLLGIWAGSATLFAALMGLLQLTR